MFTAVMSTPCVPIANDHTPVHVDGEISFAHVKETVMLVVSLRGKDMVNFSLNVGVMNGKLIFFPIKISIVSIKCL